MRDGKIRIRSYQVGFGDCFLVSIPDRRGWRHMLVDFGRAPGQRGSNHVFKKIAENIWNETDGHLDVLVMTHEHLDHLDGFRSQRDIFDDMDIDYVWMSIPSHPDYYKKVPSAEPHRRLHHTLDKYYRSLVRRQVALAPSFETVIRNNLANADRIDYVRGLPRKSTLYLARGHSVRQRPFPNRIKVHILAPERDVSVYYGGRRRVNALMRRMESAAADSDELGPWDFPNVKRVAYPPNLSRTDWDRLRTTIQTGGTETVRAIDRAQNNTSLVFLIEVDGKRLLFPGDAEHESWKAIQRTGKAHLKPVDFLKISHHGSHNGTPLDLLDTLLPVTRRDTAAVMVSTRSKVYGTLNPVPDRSLLKILRGRCRRLVTTDGLRRNWVDVYI